MSTYPESSESKSLTGISSTLSSSSSSSVHSSSPIPQTNNNIDKLRTIKPFEEKQLLSFYQNSLHDANDNFICDFVRKFGHIDRNDHYKLIEKLDRTSERFADTSVRVNNLKQSIEELESKCWSSKKVKLTDSGRCEDGTLVEAKHEYLECNFELNFSKDLDRYYYILRETIINDHVFNHFDHKFYQLKFELIIYEMCEIVKKLSTLQKDGTEKEEGEELSPMERIAKEQLLEWIAALFVYFRKTDNYKEKLRVQCYKSLIILSKELLKIATFNDRLFLLNQALRCPAGSSPLLATHLLNCPKLLQLRCSNYELGKGYVDFCATVIATILSPISDRDKFIQPKIRLCDSTRKNSSEKNSQPNESWILVDTEFEDELVTASPNELTEFDIINYLQQIPFDDMLEFVSLVGEQTGVDSQSIETSMIKLFAFNTRLIRILRNGLQNFNCLRYKELTLYIASMIKKIIRKISTNWKWCKENFTTKDQALLVRLQVEFDHFMLRSITTILSTNRRGVWPLLAKVEFDGISEPMLWHILWVVYSNGRDENNESLSGLCPYMSSNYWRDKFANYAQWKYVFIEKLSNFSIEEAIGLMEFFYNMAISRDEKSDTVFLSEIVVRISEICLLIKCFVFRKDDKKDSSSANDQDNVPNQTKPSSPLQQPQQASLTIQNQRFYIDKGITCLTNLLKQFKSLIIVLLQFLEQNEESNLLFEPCLELFLSLSLDDFIPDSSFFTTLYSWLSETSCEKLYSRLARIALSKLAWNRILLQHDTYGCLFLSLEIQRTHALKLYQSLMNQLVFKVANNLLENGTLENVANRKEIPTNSQQLKFEQKLPNYQLPTLKIEHLDGDCWINELAISDQLDQFVLWCWSSLLKLRIHPLDFIPTESAWDEIIFGVQSFDGLALSTAATNMRQHRIFQNLPRLNYDNELISIAKGIEEENPFAMYIATIMTDFCINKNNDINKFLDICTIMAKKCHHLPLLHLLYHFVPLTLPLSLSSSTASTNKLQSNDKFVLLILNLIRNGYHEQLSSIILSQIKHLTNASNAIQLYICWSETLIETVEQCFNTKSNQWSFTSTISLLNPFSASKLSVSQSSSTSQSTMSIDSFVANVTIILDRMSEQIILREDLFERYIVYLIDSKPFMSKNKKYPLQNWKLSSLADSNGSGMSMFSQLFSFVFSGSLGSSNLMKVNYLPDRNQLKSEWITPLHILVRQSVNLWPQLPPSTQSTNQNKRRSSSPNSDNYPKYPALYLAYVLIEFDTRRFAKVWDHLIYQINNSCIINQSVPGGQVVEGYDNELKTVCQLLNQSPIPYALLPINSLIVWLLKCPPYYNTSGNNSISSSNSSIPHPVTPLLWKHFFVLFFSNSGSSPSVGLKFLNKNLQDGLRQKLTNLFDYHNKCWLLMSNENANVSDSKPAQQQQQQPSDMIASMLFQDRLIKLYRAYIIWLNDSRLHNSFVNLDEGDYVEPQYQSNLLKYIFSSGGITSDLGSSTGSNQSTKSQSSNFFFLIYIDRKQLEEELFQTESLWLDLIKQTIDSQSMTDECFSTNYDEEQEEKGEVERKKNVDIQYQLEMYRKLYNDAIIANNDNLTHDIETSQYQQIIAYFNSISCSFNVNLLLSDVDNDYYYLCNEQDDQRNSSINDPAVIIVIIHQLMDSIVDEARFVEVQLSAYSKLNTEFENELLPKLYQNVQISINKRVQCDIDQYSAIGCQKAAVITFNFSESILNHYIKQKYDFNRIELQTVLRNLIENIPAQKVIGSVYFLQKMFNRLLRCYDFGQICIDSGNEVEVNNNNNQQQNLLKQLFKSMADWITSINSVPKYYITSQVLDLLLDTLNKLSNHHMDNVNYFLLETSLQSTMTSTMIQQLAPSLAPSRCSSVAFIQMYKLIGKNLSNVSQQTIFVLLSKFDVSSWLQLNHVTDEERLDFLLCLYQCLQLFGISPSDESLVTFDLYRKHLQDSILYRFPLFMSNILTFMLNGISQSLLAPCLWNNILHTFGFYTKSLSFGTFQKICDTSTINSSSKSSSTSQLTSLHQYPSSIIDFDYRTFDQDLRSYTPRQTIFSSHELYDLLQLMSDYFHKFSQTLNIEFLEHFKIYITKYLQFLSFMSYCWVTSNSSSSNCPDNLSIVWVPFYDNWKYWIFPMKSTKSISKIEHLEFAWQLFINSFQHLTDSFADRQSQFLSNLWQVFLRFIIENSSVESKDVAMFEEKLLQLNWQLFIPDITDIKLMYDSVIQNRYSVERLNAFVISRINWKNALVTQSHLSYEQLLNVVENLSYVFITLVDQPYINEVDLDSIPFEILNPNKVKLITMMLLQVMKQKCTTIIDSPTNNDSSSDGNRFLLVLLRALCQIGSSKVFDQKSNQSIDSDRESFTQLMKNSTNEAWIISKHLFYADCVASLGVYYCNTHLVEFSKDSNLIRAFLLNSIESLRNIFEVLVSSDRISILITLLKIVNETTDEGARFKLCVHLVTIFSYFTSVPLLADLIIAVNRSVVSVKCSVYLLECFIENYLDLDGDLLFIVNNLTIVQQTANTSVNSKELSENHSHKQQAISTSDEFISQLIQSRACLTILVHIYGRLQKSTVPDICTRKYVCSLIGQCSNFKPSLTKYSDESKILLLWFKLVSLLTNKPSSNSSNIDISIQSSGSSSNHSNLLESFSKIFLDISNEDIFISVQSLSNLCKSIHSTNSESLNRGFLSLFRSHKQSSNSCLFLMECIVLHGTSVILETFFPNSIDYHSITASHSSSPLTSSVRPSASAESLSLSSSNPSLYSKSPSTVHSESPNKKMLYSDSIRLKLKTEISDLFRLSMQRMKSLKKDKSFTEIWPMIDQIMVMFESCDNLCDNDLQLNRDLASFDDADCDDLDSLNEQLDTEAEQRLNQQQKHLLLMKQLINLRQKRFILIQQWLVNFYSDKNFIKSFI